MSTTAIRADERPLDRVLLISVLLLLLLLTLPSAFNLSFSLPIPPRSIPPYPYLRVQSLLAHPVRDQSPSAFNPFPPRSISTSIAAQGAAEGVFSTGYPTNGRRQDFKGPGSAALFDHTCTRFSLRYKRASYLPC